MNRPQVIDYAALMPEVPTWKPRGRRKGHRNLWQDLMKALALRAPNTHRTN